MDTRKYAIIECSEKAARIAEALRVYPKKEAVVNKKESEEETNSGRCKYCNGRWVILINGTINGKPIYQGICSVCQLSTKEFTDIDDLCDYLDINQGDLTNE